MITYERERFIRSRPVSTSWQIDGVPVRAPRPQAMAALRETR
jgi:hypothetical protein